MPQAKKKPRGFTVLTLTSKKNTETYHRNKSNVSTFFCTLSTQKVTFIDLRVRWRLHSGTVALTYVLVLYCLVSYSYVPLIEASITLHPVIVRWCSAVHYSLKIQGDRSLTTPTGGVYKSISHLPKLLPIYMKNSKK
jgi:hypothetical protein